MVGSPDYVAPEQIRGEPVDARTDVYALGGVLFRMLAGRVPFQRDTTSARVWAHLNEPPPRLSRFAAGLGAVDAVLARALAKDPADRYATTGELARDAALALGIAAPSPRPEHCAPAAPPARRHAITVSSFAPEPDATCTAIAAPAPLAAAQRRIASRTLVGRDSELAALRAAVQRAAGGDPSLTVVAGEAGIGKSRLVQELARGSHADGALVLTGACLGLSGGDVPYAPIVAALRELAAGPHARVLDELAPEARAELARAVPELAGAATTAPAPGDPGAYAQARLFELLLVLLRRLARETPTLLVVEDLHWADPSTLDFLRTSSRHARDERAASSPRTARTSSHRRHPLQAQFAEIARDRAVLRVELGPLTRAEIARQIAGVLDTAPRRGARRRDLRAHAGQPVLRRGAARDASRGRRRRAARQPARRPARARRRAVRDALQAASAGRLRPRRRPRAARRGRGAR